MNSEGISNSSIITANAAASARRIIGRLTSTGTKDTYRPRLFGQPQPADGILGVEDEVRLNFNENIGISDTNSHENRQISASR